MTFGIGLDTADRTFQVTTQLALCQTLHPIHCHCMTQVPQLRYPRLSGQHGTIPIPFSQAHLALVEKKSEAPDSLILYMQDIGIPSELHSDDAKELKQGKMGDLARQFWIKTMQSE